MKMISRWSEKQRGFMKAIRIKRFKGFKDSGWLNLKPITLFFGYNSSGKSSILNALLMLKQSLSNYSKEVPFVFSKKNGVDLGGFEDIVYEKKIDHKPNRNWFKIRYSRRIKGNRLSERNI